MYVYVYLSLSLFRIPVYPAALLTGPNKQKYTRKVSRLWAFPWMTIVLMTTRIMRERPKQLLCAWELFSSHAHIHPYVVKCMLMNIKYLSVAPKKFAQQMIMNFSIFAIFYVLWKKCDLTHTYSLQWGSVCLLIW